MNTGIISFEESSTFMAHKSLCSSGLRYPFQARGSNQVKNRRDKKLADVSGQGFYTDLINYNLILQICAPFADTFLHNISVKCQINDSIFKKAYLCFGIFQFQWLFVSKTI